MPRFVRSPLWTTLIAAGSLALAACNHPEQVLPVVQLRETAFLEGGGPSEGLVVQTSINQKPFSFLVDTGATGVMLFREQAHQANLHEAGSEVGLDAFGRKISVAHARYESLIVGEAFQFSRGNVRIADGPGLPFDGLLGLDLLRRIKAVADFGRKQVIVDPATADRLLQSKHPIGTLRGEMGQLYVHGSIGDIVGIFLIDSGSNVTIVDAKLAATRTVHDASVAVVSARAGAAVGEVERFQVLAKKWDRLEVHLHDDVDRRPGVAGHRLLGVVGLNLLRSAGVVVDFRTDQVYVTP